jgi:hypothetical protein
MASSSLRRTGETPPKTDKGHGTRALGPSDSSDTGSDVTGAPGLDAGGETLDLQRGTTSDPDRERRRRRRSAGPDIGDENLDSDSDSGGTGERAAAGRDAPPPTDEQLDVITEGGASVPLSDRELQEELVEEDREFGDEAAADTGEEAPAPPKSQRSGNAPARRRKPARPQFGAKRTKR